MVSSDSAITIGEKVLSRDPGQGFFMIYTTAQACKALITSPDSLRMQRMRKGLGHSIVPGRTGWTFDDLEEVRRGRLLIQYTVKYSVKQLRGPSLPGSMTVWAKSETLGRAKAGAWFWNAELKEHPGKWGIPVSFEIKTIKEIQK